MIYRKLGRTGVNVGAIGLGTEYLVGVAREDVVSTVHELLDAGALADFAATRLSGFKKPRRVEFVPVLPRNAQNKVQTHLLKARFGA